MKSKQEFKELIFKNSMNEKGDLDLSKMIFITYFEKILINTLPEKWKYIARDKNGKLYVYSEEPKKSEDGYWYVDQEMKKSCLISVGFDILHFIKNKDEKPILIDDLKNN